MHSIWADPRYPWSARLIMPPFPCPLTCMQVRLNDACLAILARSCPQLEELVIGKSTYWVAFASGRA